MSGHIDIRFLGELAVTIDGRVVSIGGPLPRSLLAMLAIERGRPLAAHTLIDRLWQDDQPANPEKALQVHVSRLRTALGPAGRRLTWSQGAYALALTDDEVDAGRFETRLRRASDLVASDPIAARALLEGALELWRGPALASLDTRPFAVGETERLDELRRRATEDLLEIRIGQGEGRAVIGDLQTLTREHPGRERGWRLLMLALWTEKWMGKNR